jgi:enoyl-CoA hydratase
VAEKLGFVNHVVEEGDLLKKAREIAEAIVRNNQDMVLRYKSVINDGLKLDLGHALALEKVMCLLFMIYTCTLLKVLWSSFTMF